MICRIIESSGDLRIFPFPDRYAMTSKYSLISLRTAFIYAVIAGLWILFSDSLVSRFVEDLSTLKIIQTYKGLFFVTITSILLYLTLRSQFRHLERLQESRLDKEKQLEMKEKQFQLMVEKSSDAIILTKTDGTVLSVNPAACTMFQRTESEICGLGRSALVVESDPRLKIALEVRKRTGSFNGVISMVRRDGTVFPAQIASNIFHDAQGVEINSIIIRDVSPQLNEETALMEEKKKYQYLFDNNPQPMWIYDRDSLAFLTVNDAAVMLYGYSREEFLSMTIKDIRPLEDIPRLLESVENIVEGTNRSGQWRHRKKDDTIINVEILSHTLVFEGKRAELILVNDVTERHRIEEALLESEKNYREIFNSTNEAILIHDVATNMIIDVNDAMLAMYGYDMKMEVLPLKLGDLSSNTSPYTEDRAKIHIRKTIREGPQTFEWQAKKKTGEIFWIEMSLRKTEIGGIARIIAVARNIEERKRAEESIRKNEEFQRAVMENLPIGIAVNSVDPAVHFSYMNDNFAHFYRTTREALAAPDSFWDVVYEDPVFREEVKRRVLEDIATGDPNRMQWKEIPITRKGEGTTYINARNTPIAGSHLVISTVWDVTAEKIAEQALQESELRWKFALEGAGDGLWDWNIQTNDVYFSPRWKSMLGYEENEIKHLLDEWEKRVHPDDLPKAYAEIKRHFDGETTVYECEQRMLCKDGTYKWILDRGKIISRSADGKPLRVIGIHTDITDRKRNDELIRQNEERLRLALKAANQGFYDLNIQTGETVVSPEYATMLGYDADAFIESNNAWIERLHPDDKEAVAAVYRDYIAGKIPDYRVEFRQRTKLGDWKWILSIGKIVQYDAGGKPLRMLGTHTDITDRKSAEEKLKTSEKIFLHSIDMLTIIGFDGYFKVLNPSWERTLGWSTEEMLSTPWLEFVHPDDTTASMFAISQILAGEEVHQFENRYRCKDGSIKWLSWNAYPYREENVMFGVAHDITARRRTEDAIRESELKYRNLIEHSPDAIFINAENRISFVNTACMKLFRAKSENELIGKHPLELFHPDYQPMVRDRIEILRKTGTAVPLIEEKIVCLDGTIIDVETIAAPFKLGDKNVIHVIMRDITERKAGEFKIKEQLLELQRWHEATLGREHRIMELKKEVNTLLNEVGRRIRYTSVEGGGDSDG
jgi:PAS domain S-box-containing protein